MPPRPAHLIVLAALLVLGSPLAAKDKKSSRPAPPPEARTWGTVVDYVLKHGGDKEIKGPSNKLLGLDKGSLPAKALRIKSASAKDQREHSVLVGYSKTKSGVLFPTILLIGVVEVTTTDSARSVDGYKIRLSTSGSMISMMRAAGAVGSVKQRSISIDSKDATATFRAEEAFYLKGIKLDQLSK